jgi:hypothetical protein
MADGPPQLIVCAGSGSTDQGFELCERHLDWVQVWAVIPSGAKADSGGDSQRAESLNLWRQVLGGRGHGYSDRIAGGF